MKYSRAVLGFTAYLAIFRLACLWIVVAAVMRDQAGLGLYVFLLVNLVEFCVFGWLSGQTIQLFGIADGVVVSALVIATTLAIGAVVQCFLWFVLLFDEPSDSNLES